jgi:hypothetical protein
MLTDVAHVHRACGRSIAVVIAMWLSSSLHADAQALPAPAVNAPGSAAPAAPAQPPKPDAQSKTAPPPSAAGVPNANPPADDSTVENTEEANPSAADEAPAPSATSTPHNARLAATQKQLADVQYEREHATNFWPWLGVGVGFGATLVSAGVGAAKALTCDHQCATLNWVALAVVVGTGIGTLSTVWLLRTDASLARIESHKYQLEQELERDKFTRLQRERSFAQAAPWFDLHVDF